MQRRTSTRCVSVFSPVYSRKDVRRHIQSFVLGLQAPPFLAANTEDDDISAFVQDIDARKPLPSRREGSESPAGPCYNHGREATIAEESSSAHSSDVGPVPSLRQRTLSAPYPGPVLVTESDVDERLREMKGTFLASLEGLGLGSRRREPSSTSTDRTERPSSSYGARRPDPIAYIGGARRESPLMEGASVPSSPSPQPDSAGASSAGVSGAVNVPGLPAYVRPRLASTGSVRSGFSIASEEVIGRMDPEPQPGTSEERTRRGPLAG